MNDVMTVYQWVFLRNHRIMIGLLAWAIQGVLIMLCSPGELTGWGDQIDGLIIPITQMPLMGYAVLAFGIGNPRLDSTQSGLDFFLAHGPLPSRSILRGVLAARATLIGMSTLLMAGCILPRSSETSLLAFPVLLLLALSCSCVVDALAWRPFMESWHRSVEGVAILLAGFACLAGCLVGLISLSGITQWAALSWGLGYGVAGLALVASFAGLNRSLLLARQNYVGMPARKSLWLVRALRWLSQLFSPADEPSGVGLNDELSWIDKKQIETPYLLLVCCLFLPMLVIVATMQNGIVIAGLNAFLALVFSMSLSGAWGSQESADRGPLGRRTYDLIAISPIQLTTLCWVKLKRDVVRMTKALLLINLVSLVFLFVLSLAGRFSWHTLLELPRDTLVSAIVGGLLIQWWIVITRLFASTWVRFIERDRIAMIVVVATNVAIFGLVIAFIWWFMQQSDWESVQRGLWQAATWIPMIVGGLLAAKFLVLGLSLCLVYPRPAWREWVQKVTFGWMLCVFCVVLLARLLWPSGLEGDTLSRVFTGGWVPSLSTATLMMAILLTPLSRIVILPWALQLDIRR
ncbi:MAG: hypothetical protein AAGD07_03005 [Planctomycetota bacterium]